MKLDDKSVQYNKDKIDILARVSNVLGSYRKAYMWYRIYNPSLGMSPRDMVKAGRTEQLAKMMDTVYNKTIS